MKLFVTLALLFGFVLFRGDLGFVSEKSVGNVNWHAQGMKLYGQGKYESALFFLEKAFEQDPLNVELCFYLGNVYSRKRLFTQAIDVHLRGLELSSEKSRAAFLMNLGLNYQANGQYKEALQIYGLLEQESREYPALHLQKGLIFYKLQNKAELLKSWEFYLSKAPNNSQYKSIRTALDIIRAEDFTWSSQDTSNMLAQSMREEHKELLTPESESPEEQSFTDKDIELAEEQLLQELESKGSGVSSDKIDQEVERSILSIHIDSPGLEFIDLEIQDILIEEGIER